MVFYLPGEFALCAESEHRPVAALGGIELVEWLSGGVVERGGFLFCRIDPERSRRVKVDGTVGPSVGLLPAAIAAGLL